MAMTDSRPIPIPGPRGERAVTAGTLRGRLIQCLRRRMPASGRQRRVDGMSTGADAAWLLACANRSPLKRDVKVAGGTHLVLLEEGSRALRAVARSSPRAEPAAIRCRSGQAAVRDDTTCSSL